jgi:hypothetical protein
MSPKKREANNNVMLEITKAAETLCAEQKTGTKDP